MKAISTCHGIWHWGSHVFLGSVFSGGKCLEAAVQLHTEGRGFTDVEYADSCFALPTEAVWSANQAPGCTAVVSLGTSSSEVWSSLPQECGALYHFHSSSPILCRTQKEK